MAKTRENQVYNPPEAAVDLAIEALPESSKIREFLESHRSEVKKMYLTEYDEAEHLKLLEIEKQREIEAIRAEGQRKLEEAREETQNEDASAVAIAMRLIREGATTAKELTDQGVPEKIALAFFEEGAFPTERKKNG